jgi:hypothetical protein
MPLSRGLEDYCKRRTCFGDTFQASQNAFKQEIEWMLHATFVCAFPMTVERAANATQEKQSTETRN